MEELRVPFSGYADDCVVAGEMVMSADRLSDFLSSTEVFEVDHVVARALDDGRVIESGATEFLREELCLVVGTGPRGRTDRRRWTRQHPVRVQVGPYLVLGYLHAPPTIDPMHASEHRVIVPLTSCSVDYTVAGQLVRDTADVALVVGSRIGEVTRATRGEISPLVEGEMPADSSLGAIAPETAG